MKRKRELAGMVMIAMMAVGMWSCKPTEKNYKAAYDAALSKRQQSDADMMVPQGGLQVEGAPMRVMVGGDSVYLTSARLRFVDGLEQRMHEYNVAVGCYKMLTNCSAHVSDLFTKGYEAFAAETPEGKYYAVAGSFRTLEEAAEFVKRYKAKNPEASYIGLPGAPVIYER